MDPMTKFILCICGGVFVIYLPALLVMLWAYKYSPDEKGLEKVDAVMNATNRFMRRW